MTKNELMMRIEDLVRDHETTRKHHVIDVFAKKGKVEQFDIYFLVDGIDLHMPKEVHVGMTFDQTYYTRQSLVKEYYFDMSEAEANDIFEAIHTKEHELISLLHRVFDQDERTVCAKPFTLLEDIAIGYLTENFLRTDVGYRCLHPIVKAHIEDAGYRILQSPVTINGVTRYEFCGFEKEKRVFRIFPTPTKIWKN